MSVQGERCATSAPLTAEPVFQPASALDYIPATQLEQLQFSRLCAVVERVWERVPLFRSRLDERGIVPEDIPTLADVSLLPFTVKTDLRDTYPFGLFASAQAFAIVPGVSRSGITITAGLFRNMDREAAARFSFLLSTPAIGAAAAKAYWDPHKHCGGIPLIHSACSPGIASQSVCW